jgi:hypothetical protein
MDTLGPRIMVNVGTQAVSNAGLNPRDLAPLTNDAFLATFTGKTSLAATNGISRQHNNYRQSYTTQMERVTIRSKSRALTSNNDSIEPDSAILSVIRANGSDNTNTYQQQSSQRQLQGNRNRRRSFNQQLLNGWNDIPCSPNYRPTNDLNRRRRTRSGGASQSQQITVVDQMAAQPHIPYAILPKRFEPKQVLSNGPQQSSRSSNNNNNNNNNNLNGNNRRHRRPNPVPRRSQRPQDYYEDQWVDEEEDDLWLEPRSSALNRRPNRAQAPNAAYYGPRQRLNNYYNSYPYGPAPRQGQNPAHSRRRVYQDDGYLPFNIVPSYDLNEWQGPYARSKQFSRFQQQYGGFRSGRNNNNNNNGFIRDDHRVNGSSRQSRNGQKSVTPTHNRKQAKSPKSKGQQQKRRNSRQYKQRNQNSKTEAATPSTETNELKSSSEKSDKDKENELSSSPKTSETEQKPLPPRDDSETKKDDNEKKSE